MNDIVMIESLGAQGDGVAEGGTLFVPGALPGERVRIARQGQRARLLEVIEPSAERIAPVCRHFGTCGGCGLQQGRDSFLAGFKRDRIVQALAARGIQGVAVRETVISPPASRRRVTVAARRTKKGATIGFHEAQSDVLVPVAECAVATPAIAAAIPRLTELVEALASRRGELRIVLTDGSAGIDAAVVEGAKAPDGPVRARLSGIAARVGLARLSVEGEEIVTLRPPLQRMGAAEVLPPPGSFLQATREGQASLVAAVAEAVGDARRIADLFAGCGTFSLPLAGGAEVIAYEEDAAALAALDRAWRRAPGLSRIETCRRNLVHRPLMPAELKGIGAVVIDPPRAGAREQAARLAESQVPRVASVSCNPATFARDARLLLNGGYRLDWVLPVDQFRWSPHVELVAAFSR